MRGRADVVVVGAGIFGACAALHLIQAGASDVLVLERDEPAQATSAAGAGYVGAWSAGGNPSLGPQELAVECYGQDFYGALAAETDQDFGYRRNGCLWLARDEAQRERLQPLVDAGAVPTTALNPDEVSQLTEIVAPESIAGGVFHPHDCQVSARAATLAVIRKFERSGGTVESRRPVERLMVSNGRVTGVQTVWGKVATDRVVLAIGAWAPTLLEGLGISMPMVPLVVTRIVTEPLGVPLQTPAMFVPGVAEGEAELGYFYVRGEYGRLLWGAHYGAAPRQQFVENPVPGRFDQLPLDGVIELSRAATRASEVVPLLADAQSITPAHGAPCYTADSRALLGELPGAQGAFVMAGCNETGITNGPGFGRVIAELIMHGASSLADPEPWSPTRFGDTLLTPLDVLHSLAASATYGGVRTAS